LKYFRSVLAAKMDQSEEGVSVKLLIAYNDQTPLAAMFLVISSHRATYLYGASSGIHRELMPTYALQWKAIQIAKAMHCMEYDFFGISPNADPSHPMYGLYRFKRGFGGNIFHHLGCWDYPLDDEKYQLFQAYDMNRQGYRIS
jgi:lipid II:glycine glycyltransferase (peptidoglycan interpeptide bridge formation enzyme)